MNRTKQLQAFFAVLVLYCFVAGQCMAATQPIYKLNLNKNGTQTQTVGAASLFSPPPIKHDLVERAPQLPVSLLKKLQKHLLEGVKIRALTVLGKGLCYHHGVLCSPQYFTASVIIFPFHYFL